MFRLLAPFLLASCTALVPATVAQLARTDPLTADPAAIQLVLALPPGLALRPDTAKLALSATRGDQAISGEFALIQDKAARAFALAPADIPRMRALQARIAEWKAAGPATGSFGVAIGACATGDGPAPDARGSASIRLAKDGPLLPLIRNGLLVQLIGAEGMAAIVPCAGHG